jgi:hypothetical protein
MLAIGAQQVRAVTHLDVNRNDCVAAAEIVARVAEHMATGSRPVQVTEIAY